MSDFPPQFVADWMMKPAEHGGDEVTDIEVGIRTKNYTKRCRYGQEFHNCHV